VCADWQDRHKVTDNSGNSIGGAAVITPSWIVSTTVNEDDRTAPICIRPLNVVTTQGRRKGAP
jgi:hypothetical protein